MQRGPSASDTVSFGRGAGQQDDPAWNLDRLDQHALPLDHLYTFPNIGKGAEVWVLGDGIRSTSDEFRTDSSDPTARVLCGGDWISAPFGPCLGDDPSGHHGTTGHGTSWAGTIGGLSVGVAKGVTIYNVRVWDGIGQPDAATFVNGINLVTQQQNLDPTTPLIGFLPWGDWTGSDGAAVDQAIRASAAAGTLWIVGMGDGGSNPCAGAPVLQDPAVITVGPTDSSDTAGATYGSNHGPCQSVYAPGENVTTAGVQSDSQITTDSGSASAAAHVAGAVTILREQHPYWSAAELKEKLLNAASPGVVKNNPADGTPNLLLYVARPNKFCFSNNDLSGDTGLGAFSTNLSDAVAYDSAGAADFTLTSTCTVEEVQTTGLVQKGSGSIQSVDVLFYRVKNGKAGKVVNEQDGVRFTDADGYGSLSVDVAPVTLRAGSYFVSLVANSALPGDYWFWELTGNQSGGSDLWRNPGKAYLPRCPRWTPVSTCFGAGTDFMVTLWR